MGITRRQFLAAAAASASVRPAREQAASSLLFAGTAEASSTQASFDPYGACDGDRFSAQPGKAWKGAPKAWPWWWQISFERPRQVGTLLQVVGEHDYLLRNSPSRYVWQGSVDGRVWHVLPGTEITRERRLYRIHRLRTPVTLQFLRLMIFDCHGEFPTLREVEIYPQVDASVAFPDWIASVSIRENPALPFGQGFIDLARDCPGWQKIQAQHLWLGDFDEAYCEAEPRPLAGTLSGSLLDWCQRMREPFRGLLEVFQNRNLPLWASCGSAQVLTIFSTAGLDAPWDCPRCRDPQSPKLPVYTHIGYVDAAKEPAPCGTYENNLSERGPTCVRQAARDPVFQGLPREFKVAQSHVGQMAFVPPGWLLVAEGGRDAKTKLQCLRLESRHVYAAQFHIESATWKDETWESAKTIMGNFLALARNWGGYNPRGTPVAPAEPWPR